MIPFPVLFMAASLMLGESYDFPSASAVTLNDMVKNGRCKIITTYLLSIYWLKLLDMFNARAAKS